MEGNYTNTDDDNNKYTCNDWSEYAPAFHSIMTSEMFKLNYDSAQLLFGDVVDFGCGAAKIAPFLLEKDDIKSYTGIDYSPEMAKLARCTLEDYATKPGQIIQNKIEQTKTAQDFDSGVSINSYYTWANPQYTLKHILKTLKKGATFVLATPNPSIDMEGLLEEAKKEVATHPYWPIFYQKNIEFCLKRDATFIDMDTLIGDVRSIGFHILEAHQRYYRGGLNFLVLST